MVGKPSAEQWGFFEACGERLFSPEKPSEFDQISSSRSAQLKFEVEDKLRRYYNHPGKFVDYVFSLVHKGKLPSKRFLTSEYPNLAGYCLLGRAIREDYIAREDKGADTRQLIERVVSGCVDAEFAAYAALPEIITDEKIPSGCRNRNIRRVCDFIFVRGFVAIGVSPLVLTF